jgi:hypothetical protein
MSQARTNVEPRPKGDSVMQTRQQAVDAATRGLMDAIERSIVLQMRHDAIKQLVQKKVVQPRAGVVIETQEALTRSEHQVRCYQDALVMAEAAVKDATNVPTRKETQLARCKRSDPALYDRWQREEDHLTMAEAEAQRDPDNPDKADAVARCRRIFANTSNLIVNRHFPDEGDAA